MGLSLLSPLPDPQQQIRTLQQEIYNRNRQLEEAETRAHSAEDKIRSLEAGLIQLRQVLTPLHNALGMVFGEIDAAGISGPIVSGDPRKAAVWEDWKRKMPGIPARFIDALMLHGELTQGQLRLHAKCAQGSVAGVVSQLWKNGLINKRDGKISLKEL